MLRHRQPGQTFVMAALGMVAMIGAISMVVDAGVYFVIQRQLQNAADAAALAAVWYRACETVDATHAFGCQATAPPGALPPNCTVAAEQWPCTAATSQVRANSGVALSLCQGPINLPSGTIPVVIDTRAYGPLVVPQVSAFAVSLSCEAPHWFARVFPNVAPTMHIAASAAAAIGWRDPTTGQVIGGTYPPGAPPGPLIARLVL